MVYAARVREMLWGARPRPAAPENNTTHWPHFSIEMSAICCNPAQKQKLDAGMSVKSITGNLTSTMLYLFILPIRVFFLSHFVVCLGNTGQNRRQPATGKRDGDGVIIPFAKKD